MRQNTLQKNSSAPAVLFPDQKDSLAYWIEQYIELAVKGVKADVQKVELHLSRFRLFMEERFGTDKLSTVTQREVKLWQADLYDKGDGFMPATVNGHLASLSGFMGWAQAKAPHLFPLGDPAKGVRDIDQMPLVARALTERQVASLKNTCDRLEVLYAKRDRRRATGDVIQLRTKNRPRRDRAIVYTFLSTGVRRNELCSLDLLQLEPNDPELLRKAHMAKLRRVKGKGGTERDVFLSKDARKALADYIEFERIRDANETTTALFLSAAGLPARKSDGRMSLQAVNQLLNKIGEWHDSQFPDRSISPLQPHALRHTFAFQLVEEMKRNHGGIDDFELERRLGHRSARYIQVYTHGQDEISARYVEEL
ncbi:MAG: hypothetical protein K0Q73_4044 [Paenibacillus sp.]|nr:hypothetical protein [Paenibacillus sp.]